MEKKKIMVTGGAGFIGSHLVEHLLNKEHDVIVIDNFLRGNKLTTDLIDRVTLVEGDVRDPKLCNTYAQGCDIIFHLAAYLGVDIVADNPVDTMEVESESTRNIIYSAIMNGVEKIIYASTSGVYGKSAIEKSVSEDYIVDPRSSYSIAKRYNEIYLQANHIEKGLNSIALRYFNVYGKRQDDRMVIPRFINQAIYTRMQKLVKV